MFIILASGFAFVVKIACLPSVMFADTSVALFAMYLNPDLTYYGVWADDNRKIVCGLIAQIAEALHLFFIIHMLENIRLLMAK